MTDKGDYTTLDMTTDDEDHINKLIDEEFEKIMESGEDEEEVSDM
jgi:hypothetical protein